MILVLCRQIHFFSSVFFLFIFFSFIHLFIQTCLAALFIFCTFSFCLNIFFLFCCCCFPHHILIFNVKCSNYNSLYCVNVYNKKMHIRFFFMCFPKFISFFVVVVFFLELFSLIFVILNPEISLSLLLLLLLLTLSFFFISIFCIFNPIFFYIWYVCLRIRLFHFFSFIQSVFSNILFTE